MRKLSELHLKCVVTVITQFSCPSAARIKDNKKNYWMNIRLVICLSRFENEAIEVQHLLATSDDKYGFPTNLACETVPVLEKLPE